MGYSISLLLLFCSGFFLLLMYSRYLLERMARKPVPQNIERMIPILCFSGIGLELLNLPTGWLYLLEGSQGYQRGPLFWVVYLLILAVLILDGAVGFHRHRTPVRESILRLVCLMLPMLALGFSLFYQDWFWIELGGTITLLLVFVNVQLQRDQRLKEQDKELAEKKIAIMISQIQPHFLYNILGSIEWLCETDPPKAQEATDELARFLRGNMDSLRSTRTIPASRELEHIRCYLNLERIRFGDKLHVIYHIETSDFFLPALSLQPLIENAVRHGVTKREEGGTIWVSACQTPWEYRITIEDNGVGFDPSQKLNDGREHVGIENVRSRLAAQCGGTLTIRSQVGRGTTAEVWIPKPSPSETKEEKNHAHHSSR